MGSVWHKYKENQTQAPQVPKSHLGDSPSILKLLVVPSAAAQGGVNISSLSPVLLSWPPLLGFLLSGIFLKRFVALLSVQVCVCPCASEPG